MVGNLLYNRADFALYESFGGGKSCTYVSTIPLDDINIRKNSYEPHNPELADGTLLVAVRLGEKEDFTIYTVLSTDGGKTWSEPAMTGICSSPPHFLPLRDGSLMLSYSRRLDPCGLRARISIDGGLTWGEEYVPSEAPTNDHGYAATVELSDGSLVTVYYEIYGDDTKTSILYTKWEG